MGRGGHGGARVQVRRGGGGRGEVRQGHIASLPHHVGHQHGYHHQGLVSFQSSVICLLSLLLLAKFKVFFIPLFVCLFVIDRRR